MNPVMERYIKKIKQRRRKLIKELGGRCVNCSAKRNLEFDHIKAEDRTWSARKHSRWSRMVKYEREHRQGLIQLLCENCNKLKGLGLLLRIRP
jgi:5-methylcytosine-specific restriction endonuclease McrA